MVYPGRTTGRPYSWSVTTTHAETTKEARGLPAITRRKVLAASGSAAVGLPLFTSMAAAHEVSTIVFCACTQVTVYGEFLLGRDGDEPGLYEAVLYCDGETIRRELTGPQTRQNYDMGADDTLGPDDDCRIIALEGATFARSQGTRTFTVCNEHCPTNCAAKGLADRDWLDAAGVGPCNDPSDVDSGGSKNGIPLQVISIQCSGCGRDEPGQPARGRGRRP